MMAPQYASVQKKRPIKSHKIRLPGEFCLRNGR
jgi:hypothetical protein